MNPLPMEGEMKPHGLDVVSAVGLTTLAEGIEGAVDIPDATDRTVPSALSSGASEQLVRLASGEAGLQGLDRETLLQAFQRPVQHSFPDFVTRQTPAVALIRHYLQPYREYLPQRHPTLADVARCLETTRDSFYDWVNGVRPMPIGQFSALVDVLQIESPSWLYYLLYRSELDRYFDPHVVQGRIILVTKKGGPPRPFDYPFLRTYGFGGLVHEGRVLAQMNLDDVAEALRRLPEFQRESATDRDKVVGRYERNLARPDDPRNQIFFDGLIYVLDLNPSEAYIGLGRPWLPGVIPVYRWEDFKPVSEGETVPRLLEPLRYETPRTGENATRRKLAGFAAFLRQARLLSGLEMRKAAEVSGLSESIIRQAELQGRQLSFETLRTLAIHYAAGIRRMAGTSADPQDVLVAAHNRHFHPRVSPKLLEVDGHSLFLNSHRDERLARDLLPLPQHDCRRAFLIFRLRRGWSTERMAEALGKTSPVIDRLENAKINAIPSVDILKKLVAIEARENQKATEADQQEMWERWRLLVYQTYYPKIPWEVIDCHELYPVCQGDVEEILQFSQRGEVRDTHLGWVVFQLRLSRERNRLLAEAARFYGISGPMLRDIEQSQAIPSDPILTKIARAVGMDPQALITIRDRQAEKRRWPVLAEEPDLKAIHQAGLEEEAAKVLPLFSVFQELDQKERRWLKKLWTEHDRLVVHRVASRWVGDGEYLDPDDPLALDRDVVEVEEFSSLGHETEERLLRLHLAIRTSLAGERECESGLKPDYLARIHYRPVRGDLPVRTGVIGIPLEPIEDEIDRIQKSLGSLPSAIVTDLVEALFRMEVMRCHREEKRIQGASNSEWLVEALFGDRDETFRYLLKTIHPLLVLKVRGQKSDVCLPSTIVRNTLSRLFVDIGDVFGIPAVALVQLLLDRERLRKDILLTLEHLPLIVRLINLLDLRRPWILLRQIFSEELQWAFDIREEGEQTWFGIQRTVDLDAIKRGGFGMILNRAKIERRWELQGLSERVSRHLGRSISTNALGGYGANRVCPDFDMIQAIVSAFNGSEGIPVDPGEALLAAHPTLIHLLPLVLGPDGTKVVPLESPYPVVEHAASQTGRMVKVGSSGRSHAVLDPLGFPALIQRRRLELGLSVEEAATRLGVSRAFLGRLETDPQRESDGTDDDKNVPSPLTLQLITNPRVYGLDPVCVAEAHFYTYWRQDLDVQGLRKRTFHGPVFVDRLAMRRLRPLAASPSQTAGEILYWWRQSPQRAKQIFPDLPFPVSEEALAKKLGISITRYLRLERGSVLPRPEEVKQIARTFAPFSEEVRGFLYVTNP